MKAEIHRSIDSAHCCCLGQCVIHDQQLFFNLAPINIYYMYVQLHVGLSIFCMCTRLHVHMHFSVVCDSVVCSDSCIGVIGVT